MTLSRLGRHAESVSVLDNIDMTMSLDGRNSSAEDMTSIELQVRPIVFRAAFRDMHTIMMIVNKTVLSEYEKFNSKLSQAAGKKPEQSRPAASSKQSQALTRPMTRQTASTGKTLGVAKVIMSKEQASELSLPAAVFSFVLTAQTQM